ncbi:recombinase family protein, partial [Polaromonas sp. UBA4122]|uniref:recombinase family protein n=1 Tax=Polaromonas sp. UBA4122 TaxID=1947074 RepID=UPI0039C8C4DC
MDYSLKPEVASDGGAIRRYGCSCGRARAALYARISTDRQSTENQLRELRQAAERLGWEVVGEFVDKGISGAKGPPCQYDL